MDIDIDIKRLGELLQAKRGPTSRNAFAKTSTLSYSHLKRIEEGETSTIGVDTLLRLANTYDIHPIDLFISSLTISPDEVARWASGHTNPAAPRTDNEVRIVARLDPDVEASIKLLARIAPAKSLPQNVQTLEVLVAQLGAVVLSMQSRFDQPGRGLTGSHGSLDEPDVGLGELLLEHKTD